MSMTTGPEDDIHDNLTSDISQVQLGTSIRADNDQAMADNNDTNLSVQVTLVQSPRQYNLKWYHTSASGS